MFEISTGMPEDVGIPSRVIRDILEELKEKQIPMHSFLLCRHDRLIAEGYYAPCRKEDLHRLFSVTKSFVSAAVGLLEEQGKLSLDDPIIRYFPEYLPAQVHPWLAQTTIRNMLMMRSCHAATTYKVNMKDNWVRSFFTVPPTHKPGTVFHYDTSATHTLCALVEKLTGMPMLDFLRCSGLDELGFSKEAYVVKDPFGTSMGGSGLMATSRDYLLFALLVLHQGALGGKQYLPAEYIKKAAAFQSATCVTGPIPGECRGYGYQFWCGEHNSIVCYGMGGQLAMILPEYDCICLTTADTQGYGGGNQVIYDAVYRHLLPALQNPASVSQASDASSFGYKQLQSYLAGLQIAPLSAPFGNLESSLAPYVSGLRYRITNPAAQGEDGFRFVSFSFSDITPDGCFCFMLHQTDCKIPFGFGHLVCSRFPIYDMNCAASALWLSDRCLYIKVHLLDTSVGSVHIQAYFGEEDVTVFLRKQEESLFQEFSGHLYGQPERI